MKKILVTGDRNWTDKDLIRKALAEWLQPGDTVIHGGAKGADSLASEVAYEWDDVQVVEYAAQWEAFGPAAGPIRNRRMLDERPHVVLAFHDNPEQSKGTRDCVLVARARGFWVFLYQHADPATSRLGYNRTTLYPTRKGVVIEHGNQDQEGSKEEDRREEGVEEEGRQEEVPLKAIPQEALSGEKEKGQD